MPQKYFCRAWYWGFLGGASGQELTCQCRRHKRWRCDPWACQHTSVFSSILAWRIPWPEEPGGRQFIGLQSDMNDVTQHTHSMVYRRKEYIEICLFNHHSSVGKSFACNAGDPGSIPSLRRSPGEGNGNPLQYSCLENPMDRGAWQATVYGITSVGHDLATKPPPPFNHQLTQYLCQALGIQRWHH